MKDFLFCLFLSVISWLYFFFLRKEILKKDTDSITKFVNHGIDFGYAKSDIVHIVKSEIDRIKNDPNLQHLIQ